MSDTTAALAATITRSASKQTYSTIRFLVDRRRVADAYRAYGYFRWVDDVLDAGSGPGCPGGEPLRAQRLRFFERQEALVNACLNGDWRETADPHEAMLVDLVRNSGPDDSGIRSYVHQMTRVMGFDVRRRGRLITRKELDDYTRWLAIAVSDAMHHFIRHDSIDAPRGEERYRAVTGSHILHMLRDTNQDVLAGYFNVPREVLLASSIGPGDLHSDAYRNWVRERVRQAGEELDAGAAYFCSLTSRRHRLAGLAYIARFKWLIDCLERDGFRLRSTYADANTPAARVRMAASVLAAIAAPRRIAGHPDVGISASRGRQ